MAIEVELFDSALGTEVTPCPKAFPATTTSGSRLCLLEALQLSGYVQERSANSGKLKLRRLVRQLGMPASDAEIWLGILREILWKLKQCGMG